VYFCGRDFTSAPWKLGEGLRRGNGLAGEIFCQIRFAIGILGHLQDDTFVDSDVGQGRFADVIGKRTP
jgi:hypothetical protein